jgi:uncharacterized protein (DUF1778 family)
MATISRIDIRVDEEKKRVIAKAAEMAGQTIPQYVMGHGLICSSLLLWG